MAKALVDGEGYPNQKRPDAYNLMLILGHKKRTTTGSYLTTP